MAKVPEILGLHDSENSSMFRSERMDLRFSNGVERQYERLKTGGLGAVIVVPLLDDNTVLLAREYAAGIHQMELGLPKGRLEAGESKEQGANRELQEEIGYAARQLDYIRSFTLAPAYMAHRTHLVLARDLYPSRLEGDEPEEIEVLRWSLDNLHELATRDDCSEGRTVAALYLVRDLLAHGLV